MNRLKLFTICSCALTLVSAQTQKDDKRHVFTNKEGVQIMAEVMSVQSDWKKMTIRKDNNLTFDLEPNVLSLDDQQYLKEWLRVRGVHAPVAGNTAPTNVAPVVTAPLATPKIDTSKVSLDVALIKKLIDTEREKQGVYTRLDTKKLAFDIVLTSGSREPIPPVDVKYAIIWKEAVSFADSTYIQTSLQNNHFAVKGGKELPQLIYNRAETLTTETVELNTVVYDGNEHYLEDELSGVLVRVALKDGTVLKEYVSPEAKTANFTWDKATELESAPGEIMRRTDDPDNETRLSLQLKKGQSEPGPIELANKRILISATVKPDIKLQDGVIVALGDSEAGVSIFIKERQVYGLVAAPDGAKWVAKPVPLGDFEVTLDLNKKNLSLTVGSGSPAQRSDLTPFTSSSKEGIDVGRDTGKPVGDYPPGFEFAGGIENARVLIRE